jgi:hypothetical protein
MYMSQHKYQVQISLFLIAGIDRRKGIAFFLQL